MHEFNVFQAIPVYYNFRLNCGFKLYKFSPKLINISNFSLIISPHVQQKKMSNYLTFFRKKDKNRALLSIQVMVKIKRENILELYILFFLFLQQLHTVRVCHSARIFQIILLAFYINGLEFRLHNKKFGFSFRIHFTLFFNLNIIYYYSIKLHYTLLYYYQNKIF